MAAPDVTGLTDAELDDTENAVINERERRQRLARAPQMIAEIRDNYVRDGGDLADLDAIPS